MCYFVHLPKYAKSNKMTDVHTYQETKSVRKILFINLKKILIKNKIMLMNNPLKTVFNILCPNYLIICSLYWFV